MHGPYSNMCEVVGDIKLRSEKIKLCDAPVCEVVECVGLNTMWGNVMFVLGR